MTYTFRQAATSEAKLLVGLYSESGRGKTKSGLLLANGFVGGDMNKVCMIETESGRGEAYAKDAVVGGYNVISLREEFSPKNYGAAISVAEKAKFKALLVDSASHEWEGIGGVLAMAAANQEAGKKGVQVWQKPKVDHQREFMLRLMQTPIPLVIVCMRAKYPMVEVKQKHIDAWKEAGRRGRLPEVGDWVRSEQLEPKQSDDILFEMFIHGWIDEEHRFRGTKYTLDELRDVIVDGQPISVDTGKRLAQWAGVQQTAPRQVPEAATQGAGDSQPVEDPASAAAQPGAAPAPSSASSSSRQPTADEALFIRAQEWAECGTHKYEEFWSGLTRAQRISIGEERHAKYKEIAGKVPT
jgi:hypothetical protein